MAGYTPFEPEQMLAALNRAGVRYVLIGGLAAVLHGGVLRTGDADICPARDPDNLERLAAALHELHAAIRAGDEQVPLPADPTLLRQNDIWNLSTTYGDLDIAFCPAGTAGYEDLAEAAVRYELDDGVTVDVASIDDIIRSKRTADRPKDREALPSLEAIRDEQHG
jgi:hypothetical protein